MQRCEFQHAGLTFSYLDAGGSGRVIIALHAHWMEGVTFAPLAEVLAPSWRVIALDQRGHGNSGHASSYTRQDYLGDLDAFFQHLGLDESVVLLGNSLGGVNAYQYAAHHAEKVKALVIEDVGATVSADMNFVLAWGGNFKTRAALAEHVGARLLPYLEDSFRQTPAGWRLAFDPQDILASQNQLNGDYWQDYLGSSCPLLLIRGQNSHLTDQTQFEAMAARRPHTQLKVLVGGHIVHADNPAEFAEVLREFLRGL